MKRFNFKDNYVFIVITLLVVLAAGVYIGVSNKKKADDADSVIIDSPTVEPVNMLTDFRENNSKQSSKPDANADTSDKSNSNSVAASNKPFTSDKPSSSDEHYENVVYPKDYGVATGNTDCTSSFNNMLGKLSSGNTVMGSQGETYTLNGYVKLNALKNITFANMNFTGQAFHCINMNDGCENISFIDCTFDNIPRALVMYSVKNILVKRCTFNNCGYGILGMAKTTSSGLVIQDTTCSNSKADFIELNNTGGNFNDVKITKCTFNGSSENVISATHAHVEQRFFGCANGSNININGCKITKNFGDSAIHLEESSNNIVIENNTLVDCNTQDHLNKYIHGFVYALDTSKNITVKNNTFEKTSNYNNTSFIFIQKPTVGHIEVTGNTFKCANSECFNGLTIAKDLVFSNNTATNSPKPYPVSGHNNTLSN